MSIKRISCIVVSVWLLFLSNSCNNCNESNGFELSIYKQERVLSIEPGYDSSKQNMALLKELSKKEPLYTIKSCDIQEYNWDAQIITLTEKATRDFYFRFTQPEIFGEDVDEYWILRNKEKYDYYINGNDKTGSILITIPYTETENRIPGDFYIAVEVDLPNDNRQEIFITKDKKRIETIEVVQDTIQ